MTLFNATRSVQVRKVEGETVAFISEPAEPTDAQIIDIGFRIRGGWNIKNCDDLVDLTLVLAGEWGIGAHQIIENINMAIRNGVEYPTAHKFLMQSKFELLTYSDACEKFSKVAKVDKNKKFNQCYKPILINNHYQENPYYASVEDIERYELTVQVKKVEKKVNWQEWKIKYIGYPLSELEGRKKLFVNRIMEDRKFNDDEKRAKIIEFEKSLIPEFKKIEIAKEFYAQNAEIQ